MIPGVRLALLINWMVVPTSREGDTQPTVTVSRPEILCVAITVFTDSLDWCLRQQYSALCPVLPQNVHLNTSICRAAGAGFELPLP